MLAQRVESLPHADSSPAAVWTPWLYWSAGHWRVKRTASLIMPSEVSTDRPGDSCIEVATLRLSESGDFSRWSNPIRSAWLIRAAARTPGLMARSARRARRTKASTFLLSAAFRRSPSWCQLPSGSVSAGRTEGAAADGPVAVAAGTAPRPSAVASAAAVAARVTRRRAVRWVFIGAR